MLSGFVNYSLLRCISRGGSGCKEDSGKCLRLRWISTLSCTQGGGPEMTAAKEAPTGARPWRCIPTGSGGTTSGCAAAGWW